MRNARNVEIYLNIIIIPQISSQQNVSIMIQRNIVDLDLNALDGIL